MPLVLQAGSTGMTKREGMLVMPAIPIAVAKVSSSRALINYPNERLQPIDVLRSLGKEYVSPFEFVLALKTDNPVPIRDSGPLMEAQQSVFEDLRTK